MGVTIAKEGHDGGFGPRTIAHIVTSARRAVSVVQDEFAATEEGIGCLLSISKLVNIFYSSF